MSIDKKITGTQFYHKLILYSSYQFPRVLAINTKVEQGKIRVSNERLLVITVNLITTAVTQRAMSCHYRWYIFSPPFNNSVINPSQLSSVHQQSSKSSHNTPHDTRWFNSKYSNSNSNELPPPVIHVPPPLNYSVINPTKLSSVSKQSYSSLHNTKHELQASSIPGRTSPDPSNTTPLLSTNNGSRNIDGFMVDVSKLTPAQRQHHAVMLLHHYHELCNMNDPS